MINRFRKMKSLVEVESVDENLKLLKWVIMDYIYFILTPVRIIELHLPSTRSLIPPEFSVSPNLYEKIEIPQK